MPTDYITPRTIMVPSPSTELRSLRRAPALSAALAFSLVASLVVALALPSTATAETTRVPPRDGQEAPAQPDGDGAPSAEGSEGHGFQPGWIGFALAIGYVLALGRRSVTQVEMPSAEIWDGTSPAPGAESPPPEA